MSILYKLFVILQKYDFSSKSQQISPCKLKNPGCLWYCKSTIFQANHNISMYLIGRAAAVCDTAKVRFFKQITTTTTVSYHSIMLFVILQKYDFSSKSQLNNDYLMGSFAVCDTAKVRFFKQITTLGIDLRAASPLFVILQKYDFSSKSQHYQSECAAYWAVCDTAKVRFFKQITTRAPPLLLSIFAVCDTAKVRFFKQITTTQWRA